MNQAYKTSCFCRVTPIGNREDGIEIVAQNGVKIAECRTQRMADKIIAGLKLHAEEEAKKKAFRL